MAHIHFGSAGGHSLIPAKGTQVILAGKPAFLPNTEVPCVMQELTKEQIEAIPKDLYSVTIIDSVEIAPKNPFRVGVKTSIHDLKQNRRRTRQTGKGSIIRFVKKQTGTISIEINSTKKYMTLVTILRKAIIEAGDLVSDNRRLSRNSDDDPSPQKPLFYEPIDRDLMADCFMKIITRFFGSNDKCNIYDKEYKMAEFCLLTHYYFLRIGIMQNKSRKPFAEYILRSVLRDETRFSVKTFNNAVDKFKEDEDDFTDKDRLTINFKMHPDKSERPHLDAFHEVGYFFYCSDYFKKLRNIRNQINEFDL